jgi:hypothetical protein
MEIIYLATPYSWSPNKAKRIADEYTAKLMREGHIVFSPISHSHNVADYMSEDLRKDHDFWMPQCLYWLGACTKMIVVSLDPALIETSTGVQEEINFCIENKIPYETVIL